MNTTLAGKILLFVNLVLSLAFAAWAVGIYTNHVDWPGGGVGPDRAQGEYNRRQTEITEAQKIAGLALARWQGATGTLVALESAQPKYQQWYAAQLNAMAGDGAAVKDLVFNNGRLVPFQEGQPIAGIKPRKTLLKDLSTTEADILKQIDEARRLLAEAQRLTEEINGNKENKANPKGLRDLLAEEETVQVNARTEWKYLEPFLYNRLAELTLLQNRKASLDQRVKELEGIALR
jgi:hypothetical protein